MLVLALHLFLCLIQSGRAQAPQSGIDGFINATVVGLPQQKGQSANHAADQQLLELLVKIAQQPNTWKQIHRVLETLEANNAAYSGQRIDASIASDPPRVPVNLLKRSQHDSTDDKSNDVPEKELAEEDVAFQRWKEMLFTVQPRRHAQMDAIEAQRQLHDLPPLPNNHRHDDDASDFQTRLIDIEHELHQLSTTIKRPSKRKRVKGVSSTVKSRSTTVTPSGVEEAPLNSSRKPLPKFTYHKVHNSSGTPESNFWRKVSSKNKGDSPHKSKTFVAVSILPDSRRDGPTHRIRKEKKRQKMHRKNVEKQIQNYHMAPNVSP